MIKELLEKRVTDYLQITKQLFGIYEDKLVRALRFFAKTDRDIQITSVYLYPRNPNFIVNLCKVMVMVGDRIKLQNGEILEVNESNIDNVPTNELNVILPIAILETGTAIQLYEQIKLIDEFVGAHGIDMLHKVLSSGVTELNDILRAENESLLEEITNPIDNILKSLDELQQIQYHIFIEDNDRRIH